MAASSLWFGSVKRIRTMRGCTGFDRSSICRNEHNCKLRRPMAPQPSSSNNLLQLPDRNIEGHRVHHTLPLKLHPDAISDGPWKNHVELNHRTSLRQKRMVVDHVAEVL